MVRLRDKIYLYIFYVFYHFNSNMVRLRVHIFCFLVCSYRYFNSNMVRLRVNARSAYGDEDVDFNSNMVRLRATTAPFSPVPVIFQFQYGAIKSLVQSTLELGKFYFNSNMVRLRDRSNWHL